MRIAENTVPAYIGETDSDEGPLMSGNVTNELLPSDLSSLATKADLAEAKTDIIKWLVPLLLGQAALIVALVKLL